MSKKSYDDMSTLELARAEIENPQKFYKWVQYNKAKPQLSKKKHLLKLEKAKIKKSKAKIKKLKESIKKLKQ